MLRVLSPTGKLAEVSSVMPVAEKEMVFNGRKKRFFERAYGFAQEPTGIVFYLRPQAGFPSMMSDRGLYVGNMRPEKVQSLMREMLEQGYCDLSAIKYQLSRKPKDQVMDGGESPAYSSETTPDSFPTELYACRGINNFGGMELFDDDDCEPDWDEASFDEEED